MPRYPRLVELAWDVTDTFIREWQRSPYRWEREFDIHVALASRLSTVLELTGNHLVSGNYPDALEGFSGCQLWSRVSCAPSTRYEYKDGTIHFCQPDIVILDEISDANSPPDWKKEQWPFLWACEIKYGAGEPADWDLEKLSYLVSQGIIRYGLWLKLYLERAASGTGLDWKQPKENLWVCEARLPELAA